MTPLERHFWRFCSNLIIPTKDYGEIRFDKPNGCQREFIRQIFTGLEEGVHSYVCLKGRQQGMSTVGLALDLYWAFAFSGIQSFIITQDAINTALA